MLELAVAHDPVLNAKAHQERMAQQRRQALKTLFVAFPAEHRKLLLEKLASEEPKYQGLHELLIYIQNGVFEPSTIPSEAAEVYLSDERATPWIRCKVCRVLLPYRSGFWIKAGTPSFWQASMHYFKECPGCGGQLIHRGTEKPVEISTYFPLRPEPPWEFVNEPPIQQR